MSEKKVPEWNADREKYWMGQAMLVQDGCNVSGITGSFREMLTEMTYGGLYEELKRKHPATILFIGKIYEMCGYDAMAFHEAYSKCMAQAREVVHAENQREAQEEHDLAQKREELDDFGDLEKKGE